MAAIGAHPHSVADVVASAADGVPIDDSNTGDPRFAEPARGDLSNSVWVSVNSIGVAPSTDNGSQSSSSGQVSTGNKNTINQDKNTITVEKGGNSAVDDAIKQLMDGLAKIGRVSAGQATGTVNIGTAETDDKNKSKLEQYVVFSFGDFDDSIGAYPVDYKVESLYPEDALKIPTVTGFSSGKLTTDIVKPSNSGAFDSVNSEKQYGIAGKIQESYSYTYAASSEKRGVSFVFVQTDTGAVYIDGVRGEFPPALWYRRIK